MSLQVGLINIEDVRFGTCTKIEAHTLYINKEEVVAHLLADDRLAAVDIKLAHPGESIRIMPVKDVIEPRIKIDSTGGVFPGFIGDMETVGTGQTRVLKGTAVVTTGKIVGFQEGIIDMSGVGAGYTPFSKTHNIVLVATVKEPSEKHVKEEILRLMGLKAAAYLGKTGNMASPDYVQVYDTDNTGHRGDLPRVVYCYMVQSQGLLHDTYYYGVNTSEILPTVMLPTEPFDGAIVSGNCVSACDKNTTYHHQNNPIIEELMAKHGKELVFAGCVLTNENVTLAAKKRSSAQAAKLCSLLGAAGVIISKEGFGNPDTDLMMNCVQLERRGIKTVLVTDEFAGRDGGSQSLADASVLADAVISTGNANMMVNLPPMANTIGVDGVADILAGGSPGNQTEHGVRVELQCLLGATNELGYGRLTTREY